MDGVNSAGAAASGLAIKAFKAGLAVENRSAVRLLQTVEEIPDRQSKKNEEGGKRIDITV